jgi:CheY-like chemotaxis protein
MSVISDEKLLKEILKENKELIKVCRNELLNFQEDKEPSSPLIQNLFKLTHNLKNNFNLSGHNEVYDILNSFNNHLGMTMKLKDLPINLFHEYKKFYLFLDGYMNEILVNSKSEMFLTDIKKLSDYIFSLEGKSQTLTDFKSTQTKERGDSPDVLIVDDEPGIIMVISDYLEDINMTSENAENGEIALRLCEQQQFNYIVTDFNMPKLNGLDFIKAIRTSNNPNKDTPIFMITGYQPNFAPTPEFWENVFFIQKPFEISKLAFYFKVGSRLKSVS